MIFKIYCLFLENGISEEFVKVISLESSTFFYLGIEIIILRLHRVTKCINLMFVKPEWLLVYVNLSLCFSSLDETSK